MSVIDTLTAGYMAVARRPWVILPPVLLDLFLWLGPSLSAAPSVQSIVRLYAETYPGQASTAQMQELADRIGNTNTFGVLAWQLPSIISAHQGEAIAGGSLIGGEVGSAVSSGAFSLLFMLLLLGGVLYAALYLAGIAQVVGGIDGASPGGARQIVLNTGRYLLFFGLIFVAVLLVGLPLAVVLALIMAVSPEVGSFVVTVLAVLAIWAWLYLFFVQAAIFLRGRGPIEAIRDSVGVVSRHFWSTMLLFVLVQVISIGTSVAWTPVLAHPAGVVVAVVGNAFIATGLAAAWMMFYQERTGTRAAVAPERAESRR